MTIKSTQIILTEDIGPGIVLMTLDMPGSGANILDKELFAELDREMELLSRRNDIVGLILYSAKPTIFIAGADLKAIVSTLDWPDSEIIKFCEHGRAVMARFSRCSFVTVAAIHGACVGGGLELPLWCDARVASDDRPTVIGLPEVKLGLVPGWAGTVRLPRIAGLEVGIDLVTSGRLVSAIDAKEMGIVDEVVAADELINAATRIIGDQNESRNFVADRRAIMGPVAGVENLDEQETMIRFGERIINNTEVFPFAPTVALEHMVRTASLPQTEAWDSESIAMAQVYGSPASRGLLNHFFLVDRNKKEPGLVDLNLTPAPIKTVAIVGAGLMGRSIAEGCLKRGFSIVILDAASGLADSVAAELTQSLQNKLAGNPGKPTPVITSAATYQDLATADLIIESVVETFDVKKLVLQKIESAVGNDIPIASNTSAIPIGKLAGCLERPRRFCGIHFCHPELMSLVEVVCGPQSSEQTIATAVGFVRRMKKMPVAMNDGAGFVVNRLLGAMLDQAIRLLTEGLSVTEIDDAMREFGFKGGPFEIVDVIGTDTCMYAGRTMWEAGLRCVTLSPILPRMVKLGRLGRKSGTGFYRYSDARGDRQQDVDVAEIIAPYVKAKPTASGAKATKADNSGSGETSADANARSEKPSNQRAMKPDEIAAQIVSAMVLEASHILDEELVADFRDIDLCAIHGFSFPQHQGGVLFWADQVGLKKVNKTLYKIADSEPRMEPSEMLKTMRLENQTFYPSP